MNHRLAGAAALTAAAVLIVAVACSDSTTAPTTPPQYYASETSISLLDPVTGTLTKYAPGFRSAPGVSLSTTAPASEPAMLIADNAPSVSHAGAAHATARFVDAQKHKHDIVYLYPKSGGPPTAVQHYIDGKLLTETKNTWAKINGGWYRSLMTLQVLNPTTGKVLGSQAIQGTYTVATKPCNPKVTPSCGPPQTVMYDRVPLGRKIVGYAALGLASAMFPADALAQSTIPGVFGPCTQEWIAYGAAGLAVAAAAVALAACPECGATEAAFAAALAALAKAEDALLNCELKTGLASAGSGGGGFSGGGAGGGAGDFGGCSDGIITDACIWIVDYTQ